MLEKNAANLSCAAGKKQKSPLGHGIIPKLNKEPEGNGGDGGGRGEVKGLTT